MSEDTKKEVTPQGNESWAEIVGPIVAKLQVTHAFGKQVMFNAEAAINLARLMASMARRLDNAAKLKSVKDMSDEEFNKYVEEERAERGLDNLP